MVNILAELKGRDKLRGRLAKHIFHFFGIFATKSTVFLRFALLSHSGSICLFDVDNRHCGIKSDRMDNGHGRYGGLHGESMSSC